MEERKKNKSSGGLLARFRRPSSEASSKEDANEDSSNPSRRPFRAMSFGVPLPTRAIKSIQAHKSEINSVCYNETGDLLATGSSDGTVGLWHAKEGRQQAILRAASGAASPSPIMCVHMRRGLVLGSGSDRVARVWKIESQRTLHTLTGHTGKIYAARLSPDCRIAITGGTDRKIMIFDMRNGYKMRVINSPSICNAIDVNEEGTVLTSGHQSGDVCLWDLRNGKLIVRQKVHEAGAVTSATYSLGGTQVLTSSRDNTLKILDARNLSVLGTARGSQYRAAYNWTRSSFSPDCHYAAAGAADGAVHMGARHSR